MSIEDANKDLQNFSFDKYVIDDDKQTKKLSGEQASHAYHKLETTGELFCIGEVAL